MVQGNGQINCYSMTPLTFLTKIYRVQIPLFNLHYNYQIIILKKNIFRVFLLTISC